LEPLAGSGSETDRDVTRTALRTIHGHLTETNLALYNAPAVRVHGGKAIELARAVAAVDPENPVPKRNLANALLRLADAELRMADYQSADEHYRESMTIREALLAASPKKRRGTAATSR